MMNRLFNLSFKNSFVTRIKLQLISDSADIKKSRIIQKKTNKIRKFELQFKQKLFHLFLIILCIVVRSFIFN